MKTYNIEVICLQRNSTRQGVPSAKAVLFVISILHPRRDCETIETT